MFWWPCAAAIWWSGSGLGLAVGSDLRVSQAAFLGMTLCPAEKNNREVETRVQKLPTRASGELFFLQNLENLDEQISGSFPQRGPTLGFKKRPAATR